MAREEWKLRGGETDPSWGKKKDDNSALKRVKQGG